MVQVPIAEGRTTPPMDAVQASAAYDGDSVRISEARRFATDFLTLLQTVHGLPVSARARGVTELVVSELVTNAVKHAPGPCLLDLQTRGATIDISVWDSSATLPLARAADPGRVGQHGLEIILAVSQGLDIRREPVGKRVTALIAFADDPTGHPAGLPPH
ncbi:ATP-binding protein [Streptomyces sp. NPDC058475]|uniref:ATP-binding protein n=1 Tax=Streptomyces sp. NPDC058475 TaxID=3346518 RepID=UPI00364FD49B